MKTLLLTMAMTLSINVMAGEWTTAGLHENELQAINEATEKELSKLTDCMLDHETSTIDDTACINEVFGDVF